MTFVMVLAMISVSFAQNQTTKSKDVTQAPYFNDFETYSSNDWTDSETIVAQQYSTSSIGDSEYGLRIFGETQFNQNGYQGAYNEIQGNIGYISFDLYLTSSTSLKHGYFVATSGGPNTITDDNSVIFFHANDDGTLTCYDNQMNSYTYPYSLNTWYHIEFRNIDYENNNYDFYVDQNLVQEDISFKGGEASEIDRIDLFNYNMSATFFDNFEILDGGNSLHFDGVDDYVTVTNNENIEWKDFTFEAWLKVDSDCQDRARIFEQIVDDYQIGILLYTADRSIRFASYEGDFIFEATTGSNDFQFDEWFHLACVFDSENNEVNVYINGVSQASDYIDLEAITFLDNEFTISNSTKSFKGEMDDIRIWNNAKQECEIGLLMSRYIENNPEELKFYFDFNNGTPEGTNTDITTLENKIDENYSGTLNNFTLEGASSNWKRSSIQIVEGSNYLEAGEDIQIYGTNVTITAEMISTTTPINWYVQSGDASVSANDQIDVTITDLNLGENTILVSNTPIDGCIVSDSVKILFYDDIAPSITCRENQSANADESNTYTVQGSEFDVVEVFDDTEVTIVNDINNSYTLDGVQLDAGTTTVTWTATDAGNNSSTCIFDIVVNEYSNIINSTSNNFKIYPNPTKGMVKLKNINSNIENLTISDITGKVILTNINIKNDDMIDLNSLDSGIYILTIQTEKENITTKIIIE